MTTTRVGPTRENERLPAYQLDLDSNPGHEGGERRLKGGGGGGREQSGSARQSEWKRVGGEESVLLITPSVVT